MRKHGLRLKLHEQPFRVLAMLLARPGELITREEIQHQLWPSGTFVDFENGLNSAVNRLRDALGDSADQPKFIETIPRRGYRFVATVERINGNVTVVEAKPEPQARRSKPWLWVAGASFVSAVFLLAAFGAWKHYHAPEKALNFNARDWVLISSFENRTSNPVLDGTLEFAIERELSNSQFVNVVPRERVDDVLRLMRKPLDTRIDAALGREICLRDGGIRALLTGRVEKLGTTYVVSAELVDPARGVAVASLSEEDPADSQLAAAVRRLSNRVRKTLGEKTAQIQQSEKSLEKVTTPSLHALQLYTQADAQIRDGNQPAAFELLRHAIDGDPNFASAYILAAYALSNQGKKLAEFMPYAKKALELSGQASEAERYFIEGSYYQMTNQPDHAIAAYQALLRVTPGHFWGSNNLNELLIPENRMQEIMELSVHRAEAEPNNFDANWDAGYSLLLISARPDLAHPYVQRASELLTTMTDLERTKFAVQALWAQLYPAYEAWLKDDVALARAELERAEHNPVARDGSTDPLMFAEFREALGETSKAKAWLQQASPPGDKSSSVEFAEFATLAFLCGDHAAARNWLQRMPGDRIPFGMSLLVREGMVRQANALAQKYNEWRPQFRNVAMGELLLAQGKTASGTRLLRAGLSEERDHAYPTYFFGADALARAYEREGNLSAALEVLETASADRVRANGPFKMSGATLWMADQMDLAQLYRRLHRDKDAEKTEDELRKLLIYADTDHPILRELQKRATQ